MNLELVRYQSNGVVSTLQLDDGKANVLSVEMFRQINAALDQAEKEGTVVLLTGRAGMFTGGFDLQVFKQSGEPLIEMLQAGAQTARRLMQFPRPTVAAVSGHAIAMGVFLLLSVDLRIGVQQGPFKYCLNEVQIGLTLPHFAVEMARQRLSPSHLVLATILAHNYSPEQAQEAGILDELVEAEQLMHMAGQRAETLAKLHREAHAQTKLRVRQEALDRLQQGLQRDLQEWQGTFARKS